MVVVQGERRVAAQHPLVSHATAGTHLRVPSHGQSSKTDHVALSNRALIPVCDELPRRGQSILKRPPLNGCQHLGGTAVTRDNDALVQARQRVACDGAVDFPGSLQRSLE